MNNFESFPKNNFDREVAYTNIMQIMLADKRNEDISLFIERHSKEFRKILSEHPEYIEEFEVDADKTLEKISKSISH